jgi:hypothetical protein
MAESVRELDEPKHKQLTNFELSFNPLTVSRTILLLYLLIVLQSFDEF